MEPGAESGGQSPGESRSRAPEGERAPEADELRRLRTLVCGARRARGAGSWRHELALRGIGWMRLSALRSLLDCRGRVYFCAWSWVELGHNMSRERCRASAPAKRGRGTTRRVVEGAAEQTIMRAFRKDDSPQLDLRERSGGGWRSIDPRPGILPADKGASLNSSGPKFAVDCNWRALRPQGKKNNDAADAKRHAGRP
jgi:hypothetical protein